jgi:hypothetical protein
MSRTQTIKVVDPQKKELWAPCATCGRLTAHEALTEVDLHDATPDGDIQWGSSHYTIKCCGCKTVSFCEESTCTEDVIQDEEGNDLQLAVTQKVYPGRVAGRPLLDNYYRLPYGVAQIYQQTHEAICYKQTILAGIGLRAIVEAVCEEKAAVGSDLSKKIDDLIVKSVIIRSGAEVLHSIRLIGNASAHEVKANSEEELATALEVVEHLLMGVYLIPQKAAKLKGK